jgi:uncharacterized membrane protein YfcA
MSASLGPLVFIFTGMLIATVLSGMAGSGAGFVMTPLLLSVGLPPSITRAAATFGEMGVQVGSLFAGRQKVRHTGRLSLLERQQNEQAKVGKSRFIRSLIGIGLINVSLAAWIIPKLNADGVELLIGIFLLVMIPRLFIRNQKVEWSERSLRQRSGGYTLFTGVSFAQALFGMGIGMFISIVITKQFGWTLTEANRIKRQLLWAQSMVLIVLLHDVINWRFSVVTLAGALIGGYVGTKIGDRGGEDFVRGIMAAMMAASGLWLLSPYAMLLLS